MKGQTTVIDVTDETFGVAVLEESRQRPVVVDFWAAWCQPCLMLGPVLERLAEEHQGRFLLAKLDVDSNPQAASAFRIQSIPDVKGFRDGRLVDQFRGVVPEPAIRQFLAGLLPSGADRLAARGREAEAEGRIEEAERLFEQALAEDPRHREASLGLAGLAATRGDFERARNLLVPLKPDAEAERLLAGIEVAEWASPEGDGESPLASAERAAAEGRFGESLESFLREVRAGGEERERAREAMIKLFAVLGEEDPLTREYRRKLSAALF